MVLRDATLFEMYRNIVFDRQAFKGTLKVETGNFARKYLTAFELAIFNTSLALQYGGFKRGHIRKEVPPVDTIENQEYKKKMEMVMDDLDSIRQMLRNRQNELPVAEIDSARDKIIDTLNGIWKELKIKPLKLPTEHPYRTQVKPMKVSLD